MEKNLNGLQAAMASKSANSGNGVEKGKQDAGFGNQRHNKFTNRRRESSVNSKNDRRPGLLPKKVPFVEKRPRQRNSVERNWRGEVSGDVCSEDGHPGSKKHNLNHLLNFSFAPRENRSHDNHHMGHGSYHKVFNKLHKFSKEQFLQANCQFLVKEGNDYSKHEIDPDVPVDWELVEEVRFTSLTTETTVCPICLHPPSAAKITKCGHIYCWSCILHYLALSDSSFRKCPICFDHIYKKDLRSVLSVKMHDFKVNDEITLSLMKRKRGFIVASKVTKSDDNLNGMSYQKFVIASPSQVLSDVIQRESEQLNFQMNIESDTPEVCFIESALESLKQREMTMKTAVSIEEINPPKKNFEGKSKVEEGAENSVSDDCYYFYQSADGQHIYLHSLNVRMLCHEYGSLDKCPTEIKAKIVEMEWNSMNEEKRKRHRYIQHLPTTCEYRIVELEMLPPLVSENTIGAFRNEILRRHKDRKKRAREERKRERDIKVEQEKKIHGIYPLPRYNLDNPDHFPIYSGDQCGNPRLSGASESSSPDEAEAASHNESGDDTTIVSHSDGPSFASMLKDGKGTVVKAVNICACENSSTDSLATEYTIKPLHQYSLSDALEAALTMKDCKRRNKRKK